MYYQDYLERFVVGREYPPDVRLHSEQLYEVPTNITELNDYAYMSLN